MDVDIDENAPWRRHLESMLTIDRKSPDASQEAQMKLVASADAAPTATLSERIFSLMDRASTGQWDSLFSGARQLLKPAFANIDASSSKSGPAHERESDSRSLASLANSKSDSKSRGKPRVEARGGSRSTSERNHSATSKRVVKNSLGKFSESARRAASQAEVKALKDLLKEARAQSSQNLTELKAQRDQMRDVQAEVDREVSARRQGQADLDRELAARRKAEADLEQEMLARRRAEAEVSRLHGLAVAAAQARLASAEADLTVLATATAGWAPRTPTLAAPSTPGVSSSPARAVAPVTPTGAAPVGTASTMHVSETNVS